MKKFKITFAALVAVTVVASFAFTSKNSNKSFASTTFYYKAGQNYQRLETGHTTEADLKERTIQNSVNPLFTDASKWTTTAVSFTPTSDYSKYMGSITFDRELDEDGGSDGQLTIDEALVAVFNSYSAPVIDAMPSCVMVGNAFIGIVAKTAANP